METNDLEKLLASGEPVWLEFDHTAAKRKAPNLWARKYSGLPDVFRVISQNECHLKLDLACKPNYPEDQDHPWCFCGYFELLRPAAVLQEELFPNEAAR